MDLIGAPDGWKQRYEHRLQAIQQARLAAIVPFPQFNKFPKELRDPRHVGFQEPVDLVDFERYEKEMQQMVFPKHYHTPNPAALSVCHESRAIALTKYRLCFGTPNVYADLEIDILYLGPWYTLKLDDMWEWTHMAGVSHPALTYMLHPAVKADLKKVQRIGIKYLEGWQEYDDILGDFHKGDGSRLRQQLRAFKSLKEVLLSCDYDGDGGSSLMFQPPGHIIVENWDVQLKPPNYEDEDRDPYDDLPRQRSKNVLAAFKSKHLTAKEKKDGIPDVKLVAFKRVPNVPEHGPERRIVKGYPSEDDSSEYGESEDEESEDEEPEDGESGDGESEDGESGDEESEDGESEDEESEKCF
ncbi:hypothetical protein LAWI1_G001821 [Lachnellula willkommii]|uniref:2EXR domain-containing protein n=1 Tax=Lachnellula willkommii TaxID=215461 RepID=A0A559MHW0_9HELO|nr:hypothetical protein LAWI1_G001821 [Lachnellula willkommii]